MANDSTHTHLLFSGVGELVLSPAVIGFLDAWIRPEHLYCIDKGLFKGANLLHINISHQQSIGLWIKTQ